MYLLRGSNWLVNAVANDPPQWLITSGTLCEENAAVRFAAAATSTASARASLSLLRMSRPPLLVRLASAPQRHRHPGSAYRPPGQTRRPHIGRMLYYGQSIIPPRRASA